MSARDLPSDIVHEILVNIPNFTTLLATIQSSKLFNDVFNAHPKSIVHEVLSNVAGPAIPQAARCAQYKEQVRLSVLNVVPADDLPSEEHYGSLEWMPGNKVTKYLEENHKAVRILQDFYSQRYKDRTSPTSKLEPDESIRFQRAMYRYWLHLDMLHHGAFRHADSGSVTEDDDEDDDDVADRRERMAFKEMLNVLSTDELLEILSVGSFCEETRQWQNFAGYSYVGIDPGDLADNMQPGNDARSPWSIWLPVPEVIREILLSRKVKYDELDSKQPKAILQTINGADDTCGRCHAVGGPQLLGTSNISLLSGVLPIRHWQGQDRVSLLPGLLPGNVSECGKIVEYLLKGHDGGRVPEKELFHELIDTVPDADGDSDEEQHQWSKDEWYCLECVKDLFRQRFMVWWRQTKEKNGAPHQDDCWYGYNCRTMRHRPAHALKLNHLCTPTRGDGPKPPQQPNNPN
ncbi:hypothetical protein L227DRAFT_573067 [Lentinus tigrinus ALCF2SS1-6]|uniref:F-box domain-containing protein n=1 Tax=Lentinus tigrinus ALCF2SS1-6 TaxID=1328759 RepID=A0A5C2SP41_9APHY|nr:hypothetical protein L227DRAFT_573067 [Lentinus tigrinus ALCF2SS1-6]